MKTIVIIYIYGGINDNGFYKIKWAVSKQV